MSELQQIPRLPQRVLRLYERVAKQIEELIVERRLRPGDRLPTERELALICDVSRPSVREAIIALETIGAIEVKTGDGTYVREVVDTRFNLPWAQNGDPGPGPHEQFEAREIVEVELAGLAAARATYTDIQELEQIVRRMEISYDQSLLAQDYAKEFANYHREGHEFHLTLANASRNTILASVVKELRGWREDDMWRTLRQRLARPEHQARAIADRKLIVLALRSRDPRAARGAMSRILERARLRYFH